MKRDMDLIRELLLKLEALPPGIFRLRAGDAELQIDGHSPENVFYQLGLVKDDSLIHSTGSGRMGSIEFGGLTPAGHELLDSIRLRSPRGGGQDAQPHSPTITMKSAKSEQDIERGIGRLQERINALKVFDFQLLRDGTMPELTALSAAIADTLERCFGQDTSAYRRYKSATTLRPVPDAFCKLFAVIGNGLHACIRLACGHFLTHARSLDEIRASCPEQTNGLRLISRH
jgi:Hypothetical protein (DUF2513)